MPRIILSLIIILAALGLVLPRAEAKVVVRNSQYGFAFELPAGFVEVPKKISVSSLVLETYTCDTRPKQPGVTVIVTRLRGTMDNPPAPVYFSIRKGMAVEYRQEKWKSYQLPVARMTGVMDGVATVMFHVEVPLLPEAVLILISGSAQDVKLTEATVQTILATLDGKSSWPPGAVGTATGGERPEPGAPASTPDPGNTAAVVGRYKRADGANGAFDFRLDGTFTIYRPSQRPVSGTYVVDGAKVTMTSPENPAAVVQIASGAMTSWDGSQWQRASNPGPPPPGQAVAAKAPPANGAANAPAPPAAVSSPGGSRFTLSAITVSPNGRLAHAGATFPAEQMPPDPKNYAWVVDRPDGKTKNVGLNRNEHTLGKEPGVYKIYVEFRAGGERKVMSNVLEITVPAN